MQRIMRVGVVSLAKVMGMSGLLLGLLVSVPYGLIVILLGVVGAASGDANAGGIAAFGIGGGIAFMVLVPLFYGAISFVFGLIYGAIINLVLHFAGGLELEIQGV